MEKMELYHFHKEGNHDKIWEKGIINVPDNFKSTTYNRIINFNNIVNLPNDNNVLYYQLLEEILTRGESDPRIVYDLLLKAYDISFYSNEFKRENALENYRATEVPELPSRLHSVYLTDEKGIESWKHKFGTSNLTLYRVEIEGKIFKTNEQLIPDERLSYQCTYDDAYNYWHPNFKKVPEDSNEYLTQGKIKVLEKINVFELNPKNWTVY